MNITALMPLKKESERVLGKNIKSFNGKPLFYYVLETLNKSAVIDEIIVNTDCEIISEMITRDFPRCTILKRPEMLIGNHIVMNQLIENDIKSAKNEHILQTHATNPLLTIQTIEDAISQYFDSLNNFDSLLTVNKIQSRLYDVNGAPVNHQFQKMEMTQNMNSIYKENSNLFLFSKTVFNKNKNRIGEKPKLYVMSELESIDIDYDDDFKLAELIFNNKKLFDSIFQCG